MRVSDFSVLIPEGRERDSGHIVLPHDTVYTVRMGNHSHRRCDAILTVDGKEMGGFRLDAGRTLIIQGPPDDGDKGRFTFFKADSAKGEEAGAARIETDLRGLVQVVFKPEKKREQIPLKTTGGVLRSRGGPGCGQSVGALGFSESLERTSSVPVAAGVTGLTGQHDQRWNYVSNLDYDPAGEVTISLRLVAGAAAVREMQASPRANAVPSPVE